MAGFFITFEGIEGCGKSTQLQRAAEALRAAGHRVTTSREPGGSPIGDAIRQILLAPAHRDMRPLTELLLYAASRAQHVAAVIVPALARGDVVLVDRFTDSTRAYQGAARQMAPALIAQVNTLATGGLAPHLTLLLDVPVAVGRARLAQRNAGHDRLEQESLAFHERVRAGFLDLARAEPNRMRTIDGAGPADAVHGAVMTAISACVATNR